MLKDMKEKQVQLFLDSFYFYEAVDEVIVKPPSARLKEVMIKDRNGNIVHGPLGSFDPPGAEANLDVISAITFTDDWGGQGVMVISPTLPVWGYIGVRIEGGIQDDLGSSRL